MPSKLLPKNTNDRRYRTTTRGSVSRFIFIFAALVVAVIGTIRGAEPLPHSLKNVGIEEKIGSKAALTASFIDATGAQTSLGDLIKNNKMPVILNFVYFNCPMLCSFVLDELTRGLKGIVTGLGSDYQVISVSIDPKDTQARAQEYKAKYLTKIGLSNDHPSWQFLTGDETASKQLADSVGFTYRFDEKTQEYAHTAALIVLSPDGKVNRYLYGLDFNAKKLNLAVAEAKKGQNMSTVERVLLFCYNYDPNSNEYVLMATNLMKVGGAITVGILLSLFVYLKRSERKAVS